MNDTTEHAGAREATTGAVPWWKAAVPPWTTVLILAGAGLIGLLIGFNIL